MNPVDAQKITVITKLSELGWLNDVIAARVTPHEAAGRALHAIEHPCIDPTVWDSLDDYTRTYWVDRARPIAEAVRKAS